jgi:hypothetical protein
MTMRQLMLLLMLSAGLLAGCKKSSRSDPESSAPAGNPLMPQIPGLTPQAQGNPALRILSDIADAIEPITDQKSLEAARPKLQALVPRFQQHRPVIVTAAYLSGKAIPRLDPRMARQLAQQVEQNPEFQPHLASARALIADPAFAQVSARYVAALQKLARIPGGSEAVLPLQVQAGK